MDFESTAQIIDNDQIFPDLSRHIMVMANGTPLKKSLVAGIVKDFDCVSTDPIELDKNLLPLEMLQTKVNQECNWLSGYMPRDNAGDRYLTIMAFATMIQLDGKIIFRTESKEESIKQIEMMAGKSIKTTTVMRVISLCEDPGYNWSRNRIIESTSNISAMTSSVIEEYVESADFKCLASEECFFTADSRWVTSVVGSEGNVSGVPTGCLSLILDELEKKE